MHAPGESSSLASPGGTTERVRILAPGCQPRRELGEMPGARVWGGWRGGTALPYKGEISLSSLAEAGDKESSSSERAKCAWLPTHLQPA